MLAKTWPYGTRLNATVLDCPEVGKGTYCIMLKDEKGEGHFILQSLKSTPPKPESAVIIEFRECGPFGGAWQLVEEMTS